MEIKNSYSALRFYRLQYAVKMTAQNKERMLQGKRPKGRSRPRLVSFDVEDLHQCPESWTLADILSYAKTLPVQCYFAARKGATYYALARNTVVKWCLENERVLITTKEEIMGVYSFDLSLFSSGEEGLHECGRPTVLQIGVVPAGYGPIR